MAMESIAYSPIYIPTVKPLAEQNAEKKAKEAEEAAKTAEATAAKTVSKTKTASNPMGWLTALTQIGALIFGGITVASLFKASDNANNNNNGYNSNFNFNMVGNFGQTPYQWNPQPLIWPILGNAAPGANAMGTNFGQMAMPTWNAQSMLGGFKNFMFPFGR